MSEQIYLTGEVNELHLHDLLKEAEKDRQVAEAQVTTEHLNWVQRILRYLGL